MSNKTLDRDLKVDNLSSSQIEFLSDAEKDKTKDWELQKQKWKEMTKLVLKKEAELAKMDVSHLDIPKKDAHSGKLVSNLDKTEGKDNAPIAPRIGFEKKGTRADGPVAGNIYSIGVIDCVARLASKVESALKKSCLEYYGEDAGDNVTDAVISVLKNLCDNHKSLASITAFQTSVTKELASKDCDTRLFAGQYFKFAMMDTLYELFATLPEMIISLDTTAFVRLLYGLLPLGSDLRRGKLQKDLRLQAMTKVKSWSIGVDLVTALQYDNKLSRKCKEYKQFSQMVAARQLSGTDYSNNVRDFNDSETTFAWCRQFNDTADIYPVKYLFELYVF